MKVTVNREYCDRCGTEIELNKIWSGKPIRFPLNKKIRLITFSARPWRLKKDEEITDQYYEEGHYQTLCPTCGKEFIEWWEEKEDDKKRRLSENN